LQHNLPIRLHSTCALRRLKSRLFLLSNDGMASTNAIVSGSFIMDWRFTKFLRVDLRLTRYLRNKTAANAANLVSPKPRISSVAHGGVSLIMGMALRTLIVFTRWLWFLSKRMDNKHEVNNLITQSFHEVHGSGRPIDANACLIYFRAFRFYKLFRCCYANQDLMQW
jgi:hypothetical protein